MLDTVLKWLGAGDQAIAAMGPTVAIILAILGGIGITQLLKFPLAQLVPDAWRDWTIRSVAIPATWVFAHVLGDMPLGVELVVAFAAPFAYKAAVSILRHYWPWLEAGKVLGSAAPSQAAQDAMTIRRGGP